MKSTKGLTKLGQGYYRDPKTGIEYTHVYYPDSREWVWYYTTPTDRTPHDVFHTLGAARAAAS